MSRDFENQWDDMAGDEKCFLCVSTTEPIAPPLGYNREKEYFWYDIGKHNSYQRVNGQWTLLNENGELAARPQTIAL